VLFLSVIILFGKCRVVDGVVGGMYGLLLWCSVFFVLCLVMSFLMSMVSLCACFLFDSWVTMYFLGLIMVSVG